MRGRENIEKHRGRHYLSLVSPIQIPPGESVNIASLHKLLPKQLSSKCQLCVPFENDIFFPFLPFFCFFFSTQVWSSSYCHRGTSKAQQSFHPMFMTLPLLVECNRTNRRGSGVGACKSHRVLASQRWRLLCLAQTMSRALHFGLSNTYAILHRSFFSPAYFCRPL